MRVKAPSDVVEYIRSNFKLIDGEVVKNDENTQFGICLRYNHNIYSKGYVKDVLEGKDPDLSVLFEEKGDKLIRNQDPVWSTRKGNEVTKSGTIVCGVKVLSDRTIVEKPQRIKKVISKVTVMHPESEEYELLD